MAKILVVDTETGGLDPANDSILSLGACVLDTETGEIVDRFYSLVHESHIVAHPKALAVNGLSVEHIMEHGATPGTVVTLLNDFMRKNGLKKPTLAGHNIAGFDMGFIRRLYKQANVTWLPFDYHVLDTMSIAVMLRFYGHLPVEKVSLDCLCQHFGIVIRESEEHNSLEDAVATAKLLQAFNVFIGIPSASPRA